MKALITIVFISMSVVASAQVKLERLKTTKDKDTLKTEGYYYSLPKKIITVSIPITKTTRTKGSCFGYANAKDLNIELGIEETDNSKIAKCNDDGTITFPKDKKEEKITYKIGEIIIDSYAMPDPDKVFYAGLTKQINKDKSLMATFNSLMIPAKTELVNQDKTFEIVTQTLSTIANIVGSFAKGLSDSDPIQLKDVNALNDPNKCLCEKAKITLEYLRTQRTALLLGEREMGMSNVNEATITKILDELNKIEKGILSLFSYEINKEISTIRREISFTKKLDSKGEHESQAIPLLNWASDKLEFIEIDEKYTDAYTNSSRLEGFDEIAIGSTANYSIVIETKNQLFQNSLESQSIPKEAVAYNLPAISKIKIVHNDKGKAKLVTSKVMTIPQFGHVAYIATKKFSKTSFEFDPQDGSLKSLSIESKAITIDQIKGLETVATSLAGLKKEKEKELTPEEKDFANKEQVLKNLELETKIKEAQLKIKKADNELNPKEN